MMGTYQGYFPGCGAAITKACKFKAGTYRCRVAEAVLGALAAFVALAFSSIANAAPINYGAFVGDSVTYSNVTESSGTDPEPLYGAPIIVGNQLKFFDPTATPQSLGFIAYAAGGVGDVTDGKLVFGLTAHLGYGITSLSLSEGGDYTLAVLGTEVAQVFASLITYEVEVTEVDGAPITPFTLNSVQSVFEQLTGPAIPESGFWSVSDFFDLEQALVDRSIPFVLGATKLTVTIDNTLVAQASSGSNAFIQKKSFSIDVETKVPEPATFVLAAAAAAGMGVIARRRQVG